MDEKSRYTTWDSVQHLWLNLDLPHDALDSLHLDGGDEVAAPSSFKIGHLAQSSIAVAGLLAATIQAQRQQAAVPKVKVDRLHAVTEFQSEKLYLLNGQRPQPVWGPIGGLHDTAGDGQIAVQDSFIHHRNGAFHLVGCTPSVTRAEFDDKLKTRKALDLEAADVDAGAVLFAVRSYSDWDSTSQGRSVKNFPITITKVADSELCPLPQISSGSRPLAGRTLAAHGADVLWITSPNLPDVPSLDMDFSRGKRTAQLDLNKPEDAEKFWSLLADADVFLQSYRPGSLSSRGLRTEELVRKRSATGRPLVCASLSAWGTEGPWADRRGFDAMVQTASGMAVSEAEHYGAGESARFIGPCRALDHGAGYFIAAGIMAALYRQQTEGGSYQVDVSLAGVMKYLRSLGQYEGKTGFECEAIEKFDDVLAEMTESRDCAFGKLQSIKHAVQIEGVEVGWEHMPKPLGSDTVVWLPR
ncbi:hypothetical protein LTR70_003485 [Exophiala xenobiotica]|uniref:CoA-transferase family III n=1 Tax=Lithohypha guttulata TaxID=1690604 RepID=A0ABR0KG61_9EURO|nr:hypothetical protein LTR24_003033 [Lithohypha guttulata]KAK5323023.1 hypothetical protein LTR70_003485 [Exophiala xenobiotica]